MNNLQLNLTRNKNTKSVLQPYHFRTNCKRALLQRIIKSNIILSVKPTTMLYSLSELQELRLFLKVRLGSFGLIFRTVFFFILILKADNVKKRYRVKTIFTRHINVKNMTENMFSRTFILIV